MTEPTGTRDANHHHQPDRNPLENLVFILPILIFQLVIGLISSPPPSLWKEEMLKGRSRDECLGVSFIALGRYCFGLEHMTFLAALYTLAFAAVLLVMFHTHPWAVRALMHVIAFTMLYLFNELSFSIFPDATILAGAVSILFGIIFGIAGFTAFLIHKYQPPRPTPLANEDELKYRCVCVSKTSGFLNK